MFTREFCEIFKNNFLYKTPPMAASEQKWAAYSFNYPLVFYKSYGIAAITNYKPTKNFQKSKWFFDNAIIYYIRHVLHNWLTQNELQTKRKKQLILPCMRGEPPTVTVYRLIMKVEYSKCHSYQLKIRYWIFLCVVSIGRLFP